MKPMSIFVTVLAWLSIVFTGLMALMTLTQNLLLWTIVRSEAGGEPMVDRAAFEGQPRAVAWVAEHLEVWFGFWLLVSLAALVASIGLLQRRNWARRLYVVLLALGIAWVLVGIGAFVLFPIAWASSEGTPQFDGMWTLAMVGMAAVTGALFGWLAWRLTRPPIRAEFEHG